MSLNRYFNEIESLQFQIQFSVVGGLKILRLAMERHATIVDLVSELKNNPRETKRAFERIGLLLRKVKTETKLSYDESIAAYLFCLASVDPLIAYRASLRIIEHGGLWWSVQLAHYVKEHAKQKLDYFIASSEAYEEYTDALVHSPTYEFDATLLLSFVSDMLRPQIDSIVDELELLQPAAGRYVFDYGELTVAADPPSFAHIGQSAECAKWSFVGKELA